MKTQKGFANLLLIIAGVLVIGAGVYYYNDKETSDEESFNRTQNEDIFTTDDSVEENDTNATQDEVVNTETEQVVQESDVQIISPNGGETYTVNEEITMKWWDDTDAGDKNIYIIESDGSDLLIEENMFIRSSGIDGTFSQNIGNLSSGSYKVRVCKSETNECDSSDGFFVVE